MSFSRIRVWRRCIQLGTAVFFAAAPVLNDAGFKFIWGNFLNVHAGPLTFSDPLAVLQVMVNNLYFPAKLMAGAGLILGIALILGPVFCSWVCPYGFFSELVWKASNKIFKRKKRSSGSRKGALLLKFGITAAGLASGWLVFKSPVLNYMSMPFQYANSFQYLLMQKYLHAGVWFILTVLSMEFIFRRRIWCRWICPQSVLIAAAGSLNRIGLRIVYDTTSCSCVDYPVPCRQSCSLGLDPRRLVSENRYQCTNCGDCIDECHSHGNALKYLIGKNREIQRAIV